MTPTEIIIIFTALVEVALFMAQIYRTTNVEPEVESHPHFTARTKKFYRSRQRTDGTWEIG